MRIAFDSRPVSDPHGVGRYSSCLLGALRETAADSAEIVETARPLRADVFHAPWMNGAMLHSPCPMVVTLHDLTALKRRSELLRTGVRPRLRQLAVQRAVRVIVPTEALAQDAVGRLGLEREQIDVIARGRRRVHVSARTRTRSPPCARASRCPSATCCGSAACATPTRASTSRSSPRRHASCRSCSSGRRARGRTSCPT